MPDLLTTALEMHRAGQMGPAAELYRQIVEQEQENADALHLFGVLRHQQGDHAGGIELISKAAALRPSVPTFHLNLAEVYRAAGQFERAWAAAAQHCDCRLTIPTPTAITAWLCKGWAGTPKPSTSSAWHWSCGLTSRSRITTSALVCVRWAVSTKPCAHFRRAVKLAPDHPQARSNLGQMLVDTGSAEEALPHCREAVRLQPNLAAMHHNLGNALKRAWADPLDAKASYLEAIRLDPDSAQSHARLGLVLQQEGKFGDALTWLKQAVEMKPEDGTFWEYLADLQMEREEYAEAIACWRRVLALETKTGCRAPQTGLGAARGRAIDEAEEHFHAALRLQPGLAAAHLSLAALREERGDLVAAESAIREALRVQPIFAMPHARLGTLLRGRLPDGDFTALQQRLADPQLGDGPRAGSCLAWPMFWMGGATTEVRPLASRRPTPSPWRIGAATNPNMTPPNTKNLSIACWKVSGRTFSRARPEWDWQRTGRFLFSACHAPARP